MYQAKVERQTIRGTARFADQPKCKPRSGFRKQQVSAYIRAVIDSGRSWPSYGEIKRELGFYDKAGAYRVVMRLLRDGALTTTPLR